MLKEIMEKGLMMITEKDTDTETKEYVISSFELLNMPENDKVCPDEDFNAVIGFFGVEYAKQHFVAKKETDAIDFNTFELKENTEYGEFLFVQEFKNQKGESTFVPTFTIWNGASADIGYKFTEETADLKDLENYAKM